MALPLFTHVQHEGLSERTLFKVVSPEEQSQRAWPIDRCLAWDGDGTLPIRALAGWGGLFTPTSRARPQNVQLPWISRPSETNIIGPGDVIRLRHGRTQAIVLYRRGANANAFFATERCNSLCLMCSQPPRSDDDSWRVAEILEIIPLIDKDERQLGITGGEPTLLGQGLVDILAACRDRLPSTALHVLTNGRRFTSDLAETLAAVVHPMIRWGIPLYADVPELHDHIVQSRGAFDQTLHGFYELGRRGQSIEIRVVLHRLTISRLGPLAEFIYRNLPFVQHVALMGLEPMGFARTNRDQLWIDPADYQNELAAAIYCLHNRGMTVSIYNLPLCALARDLWPFARQSISDWKNAYPPECQPCVVKDRCGGFFVSAGQAWRSRLVRPLTEEDALSAAL